MTKREFKGIVILKIIDVWGWRRWRVENDHSEYTDLGGMAEVAQRARNRNVALSIPGRIRISAVRDE